MINIILSGSSGAMGKMVLAEIDGRDQMQVVCGVDIIDDKTREFPVVRDVETFSGTADVLIDFSHPSLLKPLLEYCVKHRIAAVICTTGLDDHHKKMMADASAEIPLFFSANMSMGVNLLAKLVRTASSALSGRGFDIEILEKHHRRKLDAPSGTALFLADEIIDEVGGMHTVLDRSGVREKREVEEIGIQAIRGGNIVGDHEVMFIGDEEILTLSHHANTRGVFASGAVNAAVFLAEQTPGMYDMNDLLGDIL